MLLRYVLFSYLLYATQAAEDKVPAVYEEIEENSQENLSENIRVARHHGKQQRHDYRTFNFKNARQQDPQKIRYEQQQQVDSYLRAYHQQMRQARQEELKRNPRARKIQRPTENRDVNVEFGRKVVDAKIGDKSRGRDIKPSQSEKVVNTIPKSYQVNEEVLDLDVMPSRKREARIYVGDQQLFNALRKISNERAAKHYAIPGGLVDGATQRTVGQHVVDIQPVGLVGHNFDLAQQNALIAHQSAILAYQNSLNQLSPQYVVAEATPQPLLEVANQAVQNSKGYAAGDAYGLVGKADLEALNSLVGKTPSVQLQGLNQLLGAQAQPLQDYKPVNEQVVEIVKSEPIIVQPIDAKSKAAYDNNVSIDVSSFTNYRVRREVVKEVTEMVEEYDDVTTEVEYDETTDYEMDVVDTTTNPTPIQHRKFDVEKRISSFQKAFRMSSRRRRRRPSKRRRPKNLPHAKPHLNYQDIYSQGSFHVTTEKAQKVVIFPKIDNILGKTTKDPTNVIVINNSNDNHNHGSNVNFHNDIQHKQKIKVNPVKNAHAHHKPQGHKINHIHSGRNKPGINKNRLIYLDKKVDNILAKLRAKDILE